MSGFVISEIWSHSSKIRDGGPLEHFNDFKVKTFRSLLDQELFDQLLGKIVCSSGQFV